MSNGSWDLLVNIGTSAGFTLLQSLWQFTLIALIIRLIFVVVPKQAANLRYLLLGLGLLAMFLIAGFTFGQELRDLQTEVAYTEVNEGITAVENPTVATAVHAAPIDQEIISPPPATNSVLSTTEAPLPLLENLVTNTKTFLQPYFPLMALIWGLVALGLLIKMTLDWRKLGQLGRLNIEAVPTHWEERFEELRARLGIKRPVKILTSAWVNEPLTFYSFRPLVLLPIGLFTGMTAQQVELLLLHELAHIKRHDFIVNLLQIVASAWFFYHPAVAWVNRHMRAEREKACDDLVMRSQHQPLQYAEALTHLRALQLQPNSSLVMPASGSSFQFKERIFRLFPAATPSPTTHPIQLLGLLLIPLLLMGLMGGGISIKASDFLPINLEEAVIGLGLDQESDDELIAISEEQGQEEEEPDVDPDLLANAILESAASEFGPDIEPELEMDVRIEEIRATEEIAPPAPLAPISAEFTNTNSNRTDHSINQSTTISRGFNPGNIDLIIDAIEHGNLQVVELLLNQGVPIESAKENGRTLLILACHYQQVEIVQLLIERGADVNKLSADNYTPLAEAAEHGLLSIVELLVHQGADVNRMAYNEHTPLMLAAEHGHQEIAGFLLARGADRKTLAHNDWTAYDHAMLGGHEDIAALIGAEHAGTYSGEFNDGFNRNSEYGHSFSGNRNSNTENGLTTTTTTTTTTANNRHTDIVSRPAISRQGSRRSVNKTVIVENYRDYPDELMIQRPLYDNWGLQVNFDRPTPFSVEIKSLEGETLKLLFDGELGVGQHTIRTSMDDLAKVTYWLVITIDGTAYKERIGLNTDRRWARAGERPASG